MRTKRRGVEVSPVVWLRNRFVRSGQRLVWGIVRFLHLRRLRRGRRVVEEPPSTPPATEPEIAALQPADRAGDLNVVAQAGIDGIMAAYSFRFAAIPLTSLYSSVKDEVGLSIEEMSDRLLQDTAYCQRVIETFFHNVASGDGSEGAECLREEMFHHRHLRGSSLWVLIQAFTMLTRFAMAYTCFFRARTQDWRTLLDSTDFLETNRFMFNTYLTCQRLRRWAMPVIEAYAHFQEVAQSPERRNQLSFAYGGSTLKAAGFFTALHRLFSSTYGTAQAGSLIEEIARTTIDLPLRQSGLLEGSPLINVLRSGKRTEDAILADPYVRLRAVHQVLSSELPPDPDVCRRSLRDILPTADLERYLTPGMMWYLSRDTVPAQLIWFLLTRVLMSRFGVRVVIKVLWDMITRGGRQLGRHAYPGLPGLRFHVGGCPIFYDPARGLFGKSPVWIARGPEGKDMLAFEGSMRGSPSRVPDLIHLQALLMSGVAAAFFGDRAGQTEIFRQFLVRWIPSLGAAQEEMRWWGELDRKCRQIVAPLRKEMHGGRDPLAGSTFDRFACSFESLFGECWRFICSESPGRMGERIIMLGGGVYTHGLS